MGRDGICRVKDGTYSKTIRFNDINYQLAQNEDKNAIFEGWCDFLNYFDSSIHVQLSFINQKSNMKEYEQIIQIRPQYDAFDEIRMEYAQMLKNQLAKGNNGLIKTKYITFSIEAENIQKARPKLERIEADILNNFKALGVAAYPLNGKERLEILYETFNPESPIPFQFEYDQIYQTGLGTKDFIAPTSFVFQSGKYFRMGDRIGAVSYLQILAPELTDKMLADFLDIDKNLIVNLHIQSVDQTRAIKLVKNKVTDINKMKIEEQKKAVRTILSVPVTACAHVEETAEEAQAEQEGNLGNTTLQSEKEETVPEQKAGSEEEQTGENQKKDVNAFSTAGNGQVQDSIGDSSTKEFYTIKTKNNNTYYLVIDHANNIDNVYMLSEIDENDLKQFLSEDTTSGISSSVTAGIVLDEEQKKSKNINSVESEEQKSDSKKEKTKDAGTVVGYGAFAVMIVIGVAVGYYFKVYKPKKAGEETPDEGLEEREDYETYEE